MKETICALAGLFGAAIAHVFGGWSNGMTTLLVFMAIDYASGLVIAAVFKKSNKTENGALSSEASFKGLVKKGMTLLVVLVACRLDILLGSNYIRDGAVIAFCINEGISILENAALMGVPIPKLVQDAIEVLKSKTEGTE